MILNINTGAYPLSLDQIRAAVPNVSLPASPEAADLLELGYVEVLLAEQPAISEEKQKLIELDPVKTDSGWVQSWGVVDLTPEELDARDQVRKADARVRIAAALSDLDLRRVRPLAEGDHEYLAKLNDRAKALRAELAAL